MSGRLLEALEGYADAREGEAGRIPGPRLAALGLLADHLARRRDTGEPSRLVFVCTHNSRRSQMAMALAAAAAHRTRLGGVEVFSAGTEATAFHPNAAAALVRAGFEVQRLDQVANPRYRVRYAAGVPPLEAFSKTLDHPALPRAGFAAVMTCSSADAACPVVAGADLRIALTYDDPKAADGTAHEAATYDRRCADIARELLWAFARAAKKAEPQS